MFNKIPNMFPSIKQFIKGVVKKRLLSTLESFIIFRQKIVNSWIRSVILNVNVKHIHGPLKVNYDISELIVTCLVRNGELYVKSFIEHNFSLGVKHIVFLDNGSTDDTIKIASSYDNVTILQSNLPYSIYETLMKKYLVKRFSRNRWNLFVDIDELFDYPFSNTLSLSSLLTYLNNNKYNAVVAQMLDLFSETPLSGLESKNDASIKDIYNYYDISNIEKSEYCWGILSNRKIKYYNGGIRKTLFGTNNGLTKVPLVFVANKIKLFTGFHQVENANIADFSCVLLHYPFTGSFFEKVQEAVKTNRYMLSAKNEYECYWEKLQKDPEINFRQDTACKWQGIDSLVDNDFLIVSENYMHFIRTHSTIAVKLQT